jgi:hypothetical protein
MKKTLNQFSVRKAAVITGLSLLVSVIAAPFAELYVFPKVVVPYDTVATAKNIIANEKLFISAIFAYFVTFAVDIILAWSLYILLKPVSKYLALLASWLKLTYSIIALVALNNLVTALRLITTPEYLMVFKQEQLNSLAMVYIRAFKNHWYFALIIFGIHLLLIGFLIYKSQYIPKVLGVLLSITGLGYILTSVQPYYFPGINIDFAKYTFYGELILWCGY